MGLGVESLIVGALAVGISLYAAGILRTAIWIFPALLLEGYLEISSVSWLSFLSLVLVFAKYKDAYFDLRHLEKDRWTLIFFLTGVVSGLILYPRPWPFFAICALMPLFYTKLFQAFRMPFTKVLVFPSAFRWIVVAVTIGVGLLNLRSHF